MFTIENVIKLLPKKLYEEHPIVGIITEAYALRQGGIQALLAEEGTALKKAEQAYNAIGVSTKKEDPLLMKLVALTVLHSGKTSFSQFMLDPKVLQILGELKKKHSNLTNDLISQGNKL